MKELKFKTSKGEFLVSESDEHYDYRFIGLLSRITEEQASEIVYISWEHKDKQYSRYYNYINEDASYYGSYGSAIESLHSLLKSKGIHLFVNPDDNQCGTIEWQESEQKTFYNPYIFKIND